jgi:hypothetical protein
VKRAPVRDSEFVIPQIAHLHLEIDVASEPITGRFSSAPGEDERFSGWIELTQAIEAARLARTGDCERPVARPRYGSGQAGERARQVPGGVRRGS